jgi:hypothetical protein
MEHSDNGASAPLSQRQQLSFGTALGCDFLIAQLAENTFLVAYVSLTIHAGRVLC